MAAARRFIIVVNPRGGRRRGLRTVEAIRPLFASAGAAIELHVTTSAGHATALCQSIDLTDCAGLCVVGGDGTIREAVNGLLRRDPPVPVPLGIIPAGSGNSLAEHLGIVDPFIATGRILAGKTRPLDVLCVSTAGLTTYCINIVGWGCAAEIAHTSERLRLLGPIRYAVAAMWHILLARPSKVRIALDGHVTEGDFLLLAGCNTRYTGKKMNLAPDASVDDGEIDLVSIRGASRWQMLKIFSRVFDGSHLSLPGVQHQRVRSFAIESSDHSPLLLDGEVEGSAPIWVEIRPAALRVF